MQTKKGWKVTENVDAINCELSGSIINLEFWDGNNLESVDENIKLWRVLQVNLTHQFTGCCWVELLGAGNATG